MKQRDQHKCQRAALVVIDLFPKLESSVELIEFKRIQETSRTPYTKKVGGRWTRWTVDKVDKVDGGQGGHIGHM